MPADPKLSAAIERVLVYFTGRSGGAWSHPPPTEDDARLVCAAASRAEAAERERDELQAACEQVLRERNAALDRGRAADVEGGELEKFKDELLDERDDLRASLAAAERELRRRARSPGGEAMKSYGWLGEVSIFLALVFGCAALVIGGAYHLAAEAAGQDNPLIYVGAASLWAALRGIPLLFECQERDAEAATKEDERGE